MSCKNECHDVHCYTDTPHRCHNPFCGVIEKYQERIAALEAELAEEGARLADLVRAAGCALVCLELEIQQGAKFPDTVTSVVENLRAAIRAAQLPEAKGD